MSSRSQPLGIPRSSGRGQTSPFSRPPPPPRNAASFGGRRGTKRRQETAQPARSIFEISEVVVIAEESKKVDESFVGFLQECALCRKKFRKDRDIYMYGYLGAFCSSMCRIGKITTDGFYKLQASEPVEKHMHILRCKIVNIETDSDLSDED